MYSSRLANYCLVHMRYCIALVRPEDSKTLGRIHRRGGPDIKRRSDQSASELYGFFPYVGFYMAKKVADVQIQGTKQFMRRAELS